MKKRFETENRQGRLLDDLLEASIMARKDRIEWEEHHQSLLFGHPEYEELWLIEIGAQELYLIFGGIGVSSSWTEYNYKKNKAERKEDN